LKWVFIELSMDRVGRAATNGMALSDLQLPFYLKTNAKNAVPIGEMFPLFWPMGAKTGLNTEITFSGAPLKFGENRWPMRTKKLEIGLEYWIQQAAL
jgi:hypothetical protein